MFERFGKKYPGDSLSAEHINLLTELAEKLAMRTVPANLAHDIGGHGSPFPPFQQRTFIIVSSEDDDTDDADDESSYSSSSSSSVESSTGALGSIYSIRPRYFDHSSGLWATDEESNVFELDTRDLGVEFSVGDTLVAYWDPQRVAWIPVMSAGGGCRDRNEVWMVVLLGGTQTGSFDMTFTINGVSETVTIQADATDTEFKTQMAAHSELAETDLNVEGGPFPAVSIKVEFVGDQAGKAIDLASFTQDDLSGGSGVVILRWQPGFDS